jgi:asparagine synthase (glutamine-hydrolysing)
MCGICGLVSLQGGPVDRQLLEEMNATLVHRGPDSGGVAVDGGTGLAARRLAIIDLATGDQPLTNEDRSVTVVQNGEIYNYRELRAELEARGHRFRTSGDTEVLAHLYEERGPRFAEALRGMFAIAVWDARNRRLVLARDRFGIKPLYYRLTAETLSFASELKALLRQPGFSREIDPDAVDAFLAFSFVPAPLSIFREARKLEPGTLLVWDAGRDDVAVERYAQPRPVHARETRREGDAELAAELLERLRDSVRAHLIADVPVGVLLSGGIDSCTLAALAAEAEGRVSTFTIGFDEREFDERALARLLAERYGTDHHELLVRPDAIELLPALAGTFDEPFADSSAIPTYLVSQLARRHVKVALSGEGGDELFGCYNYYAGHGLARRLAPIAPLLRPLVERLPTSTSKASSLDWRAKRWVRAAQRSPLERHYAWKSVFTPEERAALVRRERRPDGDAFDLLRPHFAATGGAEELARLMGLDVALFMVDDMLVKTDRASMAHSLEARVPILDPVVAELALALPSRLKVRGLEKKRLLRRAVAPLLPREILEGKKRGFSPPIGNWLRNELQPLARDVLSPASVRAQGFFRPDVVTRLIDDHAARRADNSRKIWALLTFALWYDRYGNGSAGDRAAPSADALLAEAWARSAAGTLRRGDRAYRCPVSPGRIVILNGAPRSGKSSIACAIQETFDGPWIQLGVDVVKERMTPPRYQPGIGLRPLERDHPVAPLVPVFYAALYESVAAHSRLGLHVVADVGHHDQAVLADCARRLAGLPALFVGVRCPLDVILERRRATWGPESAGPPDGPVPPPVVAWQREVHVPGIYDLEVDTSRLTAVECAEAIARRLADERPATALARLARG